jgi:DNA polymerase III epsilon subunit-like protein
MKDLMIDIETLGTSSTATILSIAAVYFNPLTGEQGEEFNRKISLDANIKAGRTIDARTLEWWMSQQKSAQDSAFCFKNTEETKLSTVLMDFAKFVKPDTLPWGNGATFDITIIETAFERCKLKTPWKFWNVRDVRTVVSMGELLGFKPKLNMPFVGVRHDALDDSKHQAKYVSAIIQKIKGLS